ncbi:MULTISPECIES: PUA domain-containing protein [Metallosphaera]|uniref:PUA domain-containing protein n=1 Tax=Metallosphaera TaxID=41980 RepID=UPI001F05F724|nr:PUA domain-containing protein [Metallosphaera sedula]MCH1771769.1 pseudouridine synthase [Metallosphaera sedula]MCP6729937.1 pseudouridine synthase [Metallosphaera sedula]
MSQSRYRQFVTEPEDALPYLEVLKAIADYQFGIGIGNCLFDQDSFRIQRSVNTWRIRNVLSKDGLFLVLRPQDGLFSLTINAGMRLKECAPFPSLRVMVRKEVEDAILKEGNVFAKHVENVDRKLRAGDEALVVNGDDELLAIGKMRLSGEEVMEYKRGVALTVRERWKIRK